MEKKADNPSEKETQVGENKWHCQQQEEAYPIEEAQRRQLCAEREVRNKLAYSHTAKRQIRI